MRLLCITTVLFVVLTACYSRVPLYHCDFDNNISDDCLSKRTVGAPALIRTTGLLPNETPVQSLPNDLSIRTYAFVKTPNAGAFDQTYSIEVKTGESSVQCIDFDYYITNTSNSAKIRVSVGDGSTKQQIVEVKASSNNQWQHSQRTYDSPSPNNYQISFQLKRIEGPATFYYGLDNVYIFDGPCESLNHDESQLSASNSVARFNVDENSTDTSELPTSSTIDTAAATTDTTTTTVGTTDTTTTTTTVGTTDTTTTTVGTTDTTTTTTVGTTDTTTTTVGTTDTTTTTVGTTDTTTTTVGTTDTTTTTVGTTDTTTTTTTVGTTDTTTTTVGTTDTTTTTVGTTDTTTTTVGTTDTTTTTVGTTDTTTTVGTTDTTTTTVGTTDTTTTTVGTTDTTTTVGTTDTTTTTVGTTDTTTTTVGTTDTTTTTTVGTTDTTTTTEASTTSTTTTSITNEGSATVATSSEVTTVSPTNSIITTGTSTSTTLSPLIPLLECNFPDISCLSDGRDFVTISNGSQFLDAIRSNSSEPPRGPVSSATSIPTATSDGESCYFPYNVSLFISNTSTNWDMWFCYENTCPTSDGRVLNCSSGEYALIPFDPEDTSKNISLTIQRRSGIVAEPREQCLRYYYYITAYRDTSDRNQTIEIYIKTDNQTSDFELINIITLENIIKNDWQNASVTFNSSTDNYTLTFVFKADPFNPTDSTINRPINFALDEIKVYDASCSYLDEYLLSTTEPSPFPTSISTGTPLTTTTTQTPPPTTTTQTQPPTTTTTQIPPTTETTPNATVVSSGANLGLILGLSLGLGIPALLGIIGGVVYFCKKDQRKKDTYLTKRTDVSTSKKAGYEQYHDYDVTNTVF